MGRRTWAIVALLTICWASANAVSKDVPPVLPESKSSRDIPAQTSRSNAICVALPLSGPHATMGQAVARWCDEIVASVGRKIVRFDTRGISSSATEVMARAREQNCAALLGGIGDKEALALADAAEAAGLPLISLGRVQDGKVRANVIWARTLRNEPLTALARHLVSEAGIHQATILYDTSAYGKSSAELFRLAFVEAGGHVVLVRDVGAPADFASFAKSVATARKALLEAPTCEREALFLSLDFVSARRLAPFLDFEGMTRAEGRCPGMTIAGPPTWNFPEAVVRAGDALSGALLADVVSSEEGSGRTSSELEICDAVRLLMTATGDASPVPGSPPWEGLRWRGCSGDLVLTGGQVTGRAVQILVIEKGRIRPWTNSN